MAIARQLDLDLVEVAAEANPPVCRIMDYSRFKYEANQRAKESRRKTTNTSIKEMKYRPKIGTGDFDTKTRQVARFLGDGHKVKITIMFRGREMSHPELGKRILDQVAETVGATAKVEAAPKLDGRNMIMVLAPDRRAQQAAAKAERSSGVAPAGDRSHHTENGVVDPQAVAVSPGSTVAAGTVNKSTVGGETPQPRTGETGAEVAATEVVEPQPVESDTVDIATAGTSPAIVEAAQSNGGAAPGADHRDGRVEAPAAANTEER